MHKTTFTMSQSINKIIITGADGQLGMEFRHLETQFGQWEFYFADRTILDITNQESIRNVFDVIKPDVVINCAAYTNVELAESESDNAYNVNARGPENLALQCKAHGTLLIHFSTDYVFDGTKSSPYMESDATNPLNIYGKSKLSGEQKIQSIHLEYLIFRISWLYGTFGKNFYKTMVRLANENKEIKVVDNQTASPTYSRILAFDVLTFVERMESGRIKPEYGIFNYTNGGGASWHSFATEILRHFDIIPIAVPASQFPTKAIRPTHSKLDTTKWVRSTRIPIIDWKIALQQCIASDRQSHSGEQ